MAGETGQVAGMIDQLAKLSELAPDFCKVIEWQKKTIFIIDEYRFWFDGKQISASSLKVCCVTGRAALAWLRDALEGEIERRGWGYRVEMWDLSGKYAALVWHLNYTNGLTFGDSAVECLLAAFLAAVEGEGR